MSLPAYLHGPRVFTRLLAAGQSSCTASRQRTRSVGCRDAEKKDRDAYARILLVSYLPLAQAFGFCQRSASKDTSKLQREEWSHLSGLANVSPCSIQNWGGTAHESGLKQQRRAVCINFKVVSRLRQRFEPSRCVQLSTSHHKAPQGCTAGTSSSSNAARYTQKCAACSS